MRRVFSFGLAAALTCWTSLAAAQGAATDSLYVDFAVPDLPALAALGLNPAKVQRPGNLKELSVAAFPLVGSESTIGPGVAVAWAPVYTFAKDVDSYRGPVLRRLAFSLVTSKEGKTDAVNAGAGFRVMLFDKTDLVLSTGAKGVQCTDASRAKDYECQVFKILASEDELSRRTNDFRITSTPVMLQVTNLMTTPNSALAFKMMGDLLDVWDLKKPPSPFTARGARAAFDKKLEAVAKANMVAVPMLGTMLSDEVDAVAERYLLQAVSGASAISARLAKLRETVQQERWNWAVGSVDVGIVGQSASGAWSELKGQKYGGLLSLAFPVGTHAQVIGQFEVRNGISDATERSHTGGGGRLLVGNSSKRVSFEGYVATTDDTDTTKDGKSHRFTIGSEFRLTKGFWLEVAFGNEHTPASTGTKLLSLANFKYAFKSSPRFTEIPGSVED